MIARVTDLSGLSEGEIHDAHLSAIRKTLFQIYRGGAIEAGLIAVQPAPELSIPVREPIIEMKNTPRGFEPEAPKPRRKPKRRKRKEARHDRAAR